MCNIVSEKYKKVVSNSTFIDLIRADYTHSGERSLIKRLFQITFHSLSNSINKKKPDYNTHTSLYTVQTHRHINTDTNMHTHIENPITTGIIELYDREDSICSLGQLNH